MTKEKVVGDYDNMTPEELRKEADRRELVERARGLAKRHDARLQLVQILHSIDRTLVADAHAHDVMRNAVLVLVKADNDEDKITNGDVHMAEFGAPENWWRDATADFPKREHPDLLDDIARQRKSAW